MDKQKASALLCSSKWAKQSTRVRSCGGVRITDQNQYRMTPSIQRAASCVTLAKRNCPDPRKGHDSLVTRGNKGFISSASAKESERALAPTRLSPRPSL